MDSIKLNLSVNVNVDLSQSTKDFLAELFKVRNACAPAPVPVAEKKVEQAPAPAPAPAVEKKVEQVPAPVPVPVPAPAAEKKAEVSIEDVRKVLAEKVNDHRETIKNKLTELGAPSVTKLAPSAYGAMLEFLKSL